MMTKPLFLLAAGAVLALISAQADAAPTKALELNQRLSVVCAELPEAPDLAMLPTPALAGAVSTYAAEIEKYQQCLHQVVRGARDTMSQSEQALYAARVNRASYRLQSVRLEQAERLRAERRGTQVAERQL